MSPWYQTAPPPYSWTRVRAFVAGRGHVDDSAAGERRLDDDRAAALVGAHLGPADAAAADGDMAEAGARRPRHEVGVERRRPRPVRANRHHNLSTV